MKEYSFKLSFWGYDRAHVDSLVEKENTDFRQTLKELRKELAGEVHKLELLRVEIGKIKNEVEEYRSLEDKISRLLLDFHIEATEKVHHAIKEAEQTERSSAERVLTKKSELFTIKAGIDRMREEVSLVTNRYRSEIEKIGGG